MKLGIYLDYDQFYPANSVVCSLKFYFDHFGEPTLSPKTLNLARGLRRRTSADVWFRVQLSLYLITYWNDFVIYIFFNIFSLPIHQLFFLKRIHMATKGYVLMCIHSGLNHTKIVSRHSKIRKVCFQTTK